MKKSVVYWSPCLTKVGTVKSTLNSAISLAKYSEDYEVTIINVFGEWSNYEKYLSQNNLPFYNIMVMESNDLLKKIKKINFLNSQEISNKFNI